MKNTDKSPLLRFRFDLKSLLIAITIFFVEVLIALYVDDKIIRPYVGDILVVILIYYFIKAFFEIKKLYLVVAVLLSAYLVEFGQYLNMVELFGLQNNRVARIVLGTVFTWGDMLCYTIGGVLCYFFDKSSTSVSTISE